MAENFLVIGLSSLATGMIVGTLIGAEVYKRYWIRRLLARTLEADY